MISLPHPLFRLVALLGLFAATALSADEPAGLCYAVTADHAIDVIPLESTEVALDVTPGLLTAEVTQTFTNHTDTALEATYLYPLPAEAAVTGFELRYRDRVIRSVVREKAAARATYDAAREAGQKAALLEQHDPSLFSTAVANFLPGETVRVVLRFTQPLALSSRAFEVRFPMVTGTRYFPADSTPGTSGNAAPTPPRRGPALAANHVYAFDITVAGLPLRSINSPSHRITVSRPDPALDFYTVALADSITIPDRDFVLRLEPDDLAALAPTLLRQHTATGDYGLLTLFPPASAVPVSGRPPRPRDVMFVLDHSGSMNGARIASARRGLARCLEMLAPADRFQICIFDSTYAFYRDRWTAATSDEIASAGRYVAGITADGGTELHPALSAALDRFSGDDRDRVVILLTDGDVGNYDTMESLVESRIGPARLFTFGIGDVPNAALLNRLAALGHGQARFVARDDEVERELTDLFATLNAPVLTHLEISLLDAAGHSVEHTLYPQPLPDVFLAHPVQALFRTTGGMPARVLLRGWAGDHAVTFDIPVAATPLRGDALEKQFGRQLYDDTAALLRRATTDPERDLIRGEMLATALQFQLVTELTSRVAVERRISRAAGAPLASQSVAQYTPADEVAGSDDDTIILSPFSVDAEEDTGYYTCNSMLTGTRIRANLADVGSAIRIVTRQFLADTGATTTESALPYLAAEAAAPAAISPFVDRATLDGLPIATPVDIATVDHLGVQSGGDAQVETTQRTARPSPGGALTLRGGDDGFAFASGEISTRNDQLNLFALATAAHAGSDQWSAFISGSRTTADTRLGGSIQSRRLDGYGDTVLLQAFAGHRFSDALTIDARLAWHRLTRDDPRQFAPGSPTARYDGLGFADLDLLTAATSGLEDQVAQFDVGGDFAGATLPQSWNVQLEWHRRDATWLTPFAGDAVAPRRTTASATLAHGLRGAGGRVRLDTRLVGARHETAGESRPRRDTSSASVELAGDLLPGVTAFVDAAVAESLPATPSGIWRDDDGIRTAVSRPVATRRAVEAGLRFELVEGRISGGVSGFNASVSDFTTLDWSWDAGHPGFTTLDDGAMRSDFSVTTARAVRQQGWRGTLVLQPVKPLAARLAWSHTDLDGAPWHGGTDHFSAFASYRFESGLLKNLFVGGGALYRDTLTYSDGFALSGGWRGDLLLGYELRRRARPVLLVQLNLINLANRSWAVTRFAPDRGREAVLTVSHPF